MLAVVVSDGGDVPDWRAGVLDAWREGQSLSAVGPGPVEAHLELARSIAALIGPDVGAGLDLGSGAGIPGLAVAGLLPDTAWTLLDASRRRTALLARTVADLGWSDRVTVVHERAELFAREAGVARSFDVVVARSFGPAAVTAECAAPLVRPGGRILVAEPPQPDEARWPPAGLDVLGLTRGPRSHNPGIQVLVATGTPEGRFPRKPGVATRRPLW